MLEPAHASLLALVKGVTVVQAQRLSSESIEAARGLILTTMVVVQAGEAGLVQREAAALDGLYADLVAHQPNGGAWCRLLHILWRAGATAWAQTEPEKAYVPGLLFNTIALADFEIDDGAVLAMLEPLLRDKRKQTGGSELIGAAYETLLGHSVTSEVTGAASASTSALVVKENGRRRDTGAHYTPRSLAEAVVDGALQPLLDDGGPLLTSQQILRLRVCDPAAGGGALLVAACRVLAQALVAAWRREGCADDSDGALAMRARGAVATSCVFGVDKDPSAVEVARASLWVFVGDSRVSLAAFTTCVRQGDSVCSDFSWAQSFPSAFERDNPGFDSVIGNPPFLGGKRISTVLGREYADALAARHASAGRNADLAAHFLRRAFELVRSRGTLGFLVTNTIAQGETRAAGLGYVVTHGGTIYRAVRRAVWPGRASVVASIVHIRRGEALTPSVLDGRFVQRISSHLTDGDETKPQRLVANRGIAFIGCYLRGMGFTFDDSSPDASPMSAMRGLLASEPATQEVVFPYLGGEELNASPTQAHRRYVIAFGDKSESAARAYRGAFSIVEQKVRPARQALGDSTSDRAHKRAWWRFANTRPEMMHALRGLSRALVVARVSNALSFAFVSPRVVCSEQVVVFALDDFASFAILASRVHALWARRYSSTLGDGLRYTPSTCFETFPLPVGYRGSAPLRVAGEAYYEARSAWMEKRRVGLQLYARSIEDPKNRTPEMEHMRRLGDALDRAVLNAYGWHDLPASRSFDVTQAGRFARYAWPEAVGEQVLRRLLVLNLREGVLLRGTVGLNDY